MRAPWSANSAPLYFDSSSSQVGTPEARPDWSDTPTVSEGGPSNGPFYDAYLGLLQADFFSVNDPLVPDCPAPALVEAPRGALAKLSDAAITAAAAPLALSLVAVVAVVLAAVRRKRRSAASAGKVEQPPML